MRRRCSSRARPCRLRITGWLALSRSPTSWASLKPCGSTTCTRAAVVGPMVRTTLGRGDDMPDGSSRRAVARGGAGAGSGAP